MLQLSVTALFYLEDSRKIHLRGVRACRSKDTKERESAREQATLAPLFICLSLSGPVLCNLGQPGVLFVLPEVLTGVLGIFFCSLFAGFSLPCLLATAILDSFSLFCLPNISPSRDGRPKSLGIRASRSFWLLPAELGWWGYWASPSC